MGFKRSDRFEAYGRLVFCRYLCLFYALYFSIIHILSLHTRLEIYDIFNIIVDLLLSIGSMSNL